MDKLVHQPAYAELSFRPITFIPALRRESVGAKEPAANDLLIPLNAPFQADQQVQGTNQVMPGPLVYGPAPPSTRGTAGGLKSKQELFREEDVQLHWSNVSRAGAGLQNLGNTCFMNSVLQCLAHTPPLAEAVLSGRAQCPPTSNNSDDPLATTLAHIKRVFSTHGIVRPTGQVKTLRTVNKRFRVGRQEDSHEYLRCLLDALHEACLKPFKPKPPPHLATTTFINRIFGARLRSRIRCHGVDYESSTYEAFMDLSLEINRASTITRALQHFTAKETLDGDNKYRCPKNNKLVRADKQITIEEAPNVLTIHLKRFQFGGMGSKITKLVSYDKEMNLQPFMSHQECGPQWYDLYGVLVHLGHSVHSGHYYCFVRAGNGIWHKCDDTQVGQCSERTVLGQQAYILFYVRREPRTSSAQARTNSAHASAAVSARQRAAAANGVDSLLMNGHLPNGKVASANGSHLANGLTSNGKAQAASLDESSQSNGKKQAASPVGNNQLNSKTQVDSQGGSVAAANGPVRANSDVKAGRPKENGSSAGEDAQGAGAPGASGKGAAAGNKRGLPGAPQAVPAAVAAPGAGLGSNSVVGVDGGVLHPPSKKARGAGDEQLQGIGAAEGPRQQQQQYQSASVPDSQDQGLQGPGSGVDNSSPSIILSPFAQPSAGQRGHTLARIAAHLSRCHPPTSGLTSHLSAHLSMHHGHRNQRLARELPAKSRTEVKQHRGQQQEQQQQQQHLQENTAARVEGSMGEGSRQQEGTTEGHVHGSTSEALALQSSPQPPTSPDQMYSGRGKKQQQQQQEERRKAETEKGSPQAHAPPGKGEDGSKDGSQQQGHEDGHTQTHQPPQKQQQQQPKSQQKKQQEQQQQQRHQQQQQLQQEKQQQWQQQHKGEGEGEQVLAGADAARLLGSGNMALGGWGAFGQGKPAGVQPWADVDPHVAQQQADMLGRQQQKRSWQLDTWDQEYDAGKTKKVRNKGGAGADLHAGGNAFQAFQQQKRGIGSNNNKQRRGSKEGRSFGGGRNRGGRGGGRGGSPHFALRGGGGRGRGKFRD